MPPVDPTMPPHDTNHHQPEQIEALPSPRSKWLQWTILVLLVTTLVLGGWLYHLTTAPEGFEPREVTILPGSTVADITHDIRNAGVVRSEPVLYGVIVSLYRDMTIKAGTYSFVTPQNVLAVAYQLTNTTPADELVRVTLPEGMTVAGYEAILAASLPEFDGATYRALTASAEGYLFPETYYVPVHYTTAELVTLLREGSNAILSEYQDVITRSNLTPYEVLILASILEREANTPESMKMVSGILQNRIAIGMPLQADATIEYVLDKPLHELPEGELANQLREVESPYNTYQNRGLPPTPIGNPGRIAIEAVLFPTPSEYLFYITGTDGAFYYAETYDEHQININRYLR